MTKRRMQVEYSASLYVTDATVTWRMLLSLKSFLFLLHPHQLILHIITYLSVTIASTIH